MCFSTHSIDIPLFGNVNTPLSFRETNQNLWNDKCEYLQIEDINNLNPACHNLIVLQLNICGTVSKNQN